ncbi:MAG: CCA tRNA nucleotidyltransferase, partial [Oscillospiraceae bacterium]|nr:CCA tRNA nucleotidyltransferase [Oscillospiraceae bacterium]
PDRGLVDPFHGIEDLQAGVLRAVGDPVKRFEEDALRILRALRFAAKYDLTVEPATAQAARDLAPRLFHVSRERVTQELWSLLSAPDGAAVARILEEFRPVVLQVLPELTACVGFDQRSLWHEYDVWEHQLRTLAAVEGMEGEDLPLVRLAALLHDVGKPASCTQDPDGTRHFCGHWDVGADMVRGMLNIQLRLPAQVRDAVVDLVRIHDHPMEPTPRTVRRALSSLGERRVRQWMALHRADLIAHGLPEQRRQRLLEERDKTVRFAALLEEELARAACLNLRDLAVKGRDLMALGFAPGPQLGHTLNALLEAVLDERLENRREPLLEEAARLLAAGLAQ